MTTTRGKLLTAHIIAEVVLDNGGITLDLSYRAVKRTDGYAVSRAGCEIRIPRHLLSDAFDHIGLAIEVLSVALEYQRARAFPDAYIGLWLEGDTCFLDVSDILSDFDDAISLARANGQRAIYGFQDATAFPVV